MKVTLTRSHQKPPEIRQCRPRREWMDETFNKHAYKCLPLTAANVHGWEIRLPQTVVVQWEGGNNVPRVLSGQTITHELEDGQTYERDVVQQSVIGAVSFAVGWAINTPPGHSVWMSGAPNYFIDGAVPMTAMVPGWWPDEVNMNWVITTPNKPVTFPEGMPFMFFQVVEDEALSKVEFDVRNMWDDQELMESRMSYGAAKSQKMTDQPWTWMGSVRTGLNEKEEQIGPKHQGHPKLEEPDA